MKRFKIFGFIILLALFILLLFGSCRKTKALENGFDGFYLSISQRDQDQYGASIIYDIGTQNLQSGTSDFFILESTSYLYLFIDNDNVLRIVAPQTSYTEVYSLQNTRIIECRIVEDLNSLYLIVYKINFSIQSAPNLQPSIDGINKTMLTRFNISYYSTYAFDKWQNDDLDILLITGNVNYNTNCLLNCCYISSSDSVADIDNWVSRQLSNYVSLNGLLSSAYDLGFDDGYSDGSADGEQVGYDNGYDEGLEDGWNDGYNDGYAAGEMSTDSWQSGYDAGFQDGEETQTAYQDGYRDGQSGETAISPVFRIISDVFGAIGAIMAVELVPHIPLGLFILVPLFFAALGLILWIWRRN